jgi:hypothetical protein
MSPPPLPPFTKRFPKKTLALSKSTASITLNNSGIISTGSVTASASATGYDSNVTSAISSNISRSNLEPYISNIIQELYKKNNILPNVTLSEVNSSLEPNIVSDVSNSTGIAYTTTQTGTSSVTTIDQYSSDYEYGYYYNSYLNLLDGSGVFNGVTGVQYYSSTGIADISNGIVLTESYYTDPLGVGVYTVLSETLSVLFLLSVFYSDQTTFESISSVIQAGISVANQNNGSLGLFGYEWTITNGIMTYNDSYGSFDTNTSGDMYIALSYIFGDLLWPDNGYNSYASDYISAMRLNTVDSSGTYLLFDTYQDALTASSNEYSRSGINWHPDYSDLTAISLFQVYDNSGSQQSFWQSVFVSTFQMNYLLFNSCTGYTYIDNISFMYPDISGSDIYYNNGVGGYMLPSSNYAYSNNDIVPISTYPQNIQLLSTCVNFSNAIYTNIFNYSYENILSANMPNISRTSNMYGNDSFRSAIKLSLFTYLYGSFSSTDYYNISYNICSNMAQTLLNSYTYYSCQSLTNNIIIDFSNNKYNSQYTFDSSGNYNPQYNYDTNGNLVQIDLSLDYGYIQNYIAAGLYALCGQYGNGGQLVSSEYDYYPGTTVPYIDYVISTLESQFPDSLGNQSIINMEYNSSNGGDTAYTLLGLTIGPNYVPNSFSQIYYAIVDIQPSLVLPFTPLYTQPPPS